MTTPQSPEEFAALLAETVQVQAGDGYRCWTTDLLTGRPLSFDLPLAVDSFTLGKTNGYGTASGTISLDAADDPLLVLAERRTCLWIAHQEQVVWGGIVWDTDPDITGRTMRVTAQTWTSFFEHILITDTLVYRNTTGGVDQLDVFRALLTYAQAKAGANIGVTVDSGMSGRLITQLWGPGSGDSARPDKQVSEAMKEIAEVDTGFDWCDDVLDDGSRNPVKRIRLGSPTLGSGSAAVLLEYPGIITGYTWTGAGKGSPTKLYALGAGDGGQTLVESATNAAELRVGYPLLEASTGSDHKEIVRRVTLQAAAQADLAAIGSSRLAPVFTIAATPSGPQPGDIGAGSRIRCRLSSAYHRPQPDGSPGYDGYFRATGVTVTPQRAGQDGKMAIATVPDGLA